MNNQPESQVIKELNKMYQENKSDMKAELEASRPAPPEESQDERIREAFDAWSNYEYVVDKFHDDHVFTVQDVVYCMGIVEERFKSRDEEVERLKTLNEKLEINMQKVSTGTDHIVHNRDKKIRKLRAQIEEMKEFLEIVSKWKDAYPEDVFRPMENKQYYDMCEHWGYAVDRVSAHVLRPIIKSYSDMAIRLLEKET